MLAFGPGAVGIMKVVMIEIENVYVYRGRESSGLWL